MMMMDYYELMESFQTAVRLGGPIKGIAVDSKVYGAREGTLIIETDYSTVTLINHRTENYVSESILIGLLSRDLMGLGYEVRMTSSTIDRATESYSVACTRPWERVPYAKHTSHNLLGSMLDVWVMARERHQAVHSTTPVYYPRREEADEDAEE